MTENTVSDNKYEATAWLSGPKPFDLELPSGQLCQVRSLEMEDIIRLDIVDDLDMFTAMFADEDDSAGGEGKSDLDYLKKLNEGGRFDNLLASMNKVAMVTVIQPELLEPPKDRSKRKSNRVYIDQIGFMDKQAIFTAVFNGLSDMSKSGEESQADLGDLAAEPVTVDLPE